MGVLDFVDFFSRQGIIKIGPRSSALTAVPLEPGQMMTPDKGFLSRSHVPGSNPLNESSIEVAVASMRAWRHNRLLGIQAKERHFARRTQGGASCR